MERKKKIKFYKVATMPVLRYRCENLNLTRNDIQELPVNYETIKSIRGCSKFQKNPS